MDALYSPRTQALALIPRFSSSPSSSSPPPPSSVCLCLSRIQSIRIEFFGFSPKLRLRSRRKCKRLQFHTAQVPVASLNSLPIVAVFAMTMSAIAVVYSNFYHSRRKEDSNEVYGPPSSEYDQQGRDTREQGVYSPTDAEQLHSDSLKEENYSPQVRESTSKDKEDGVKLSYQNSSTPEDAPYIEQADIPDSNFQDLGTIASPLSEKSEEIGLFLPQAPEHLHIESLMEKNYTLPEAIESVPKEGRVKLSYQDPLTTEETLDVERAGFPDSNFHDLGSISSALPHKSEKIGFSLPLTPPELDVLPPLALLMAESDVVNCGKETDLDLMSPAHAFEVKDAVSVLVDTAGIKDNNHEDPNHEHGACELQATSWYERSGREELYLFYENTPALDYPKLLQGLSGSSTKESLLENNNVSMTTRSSAPIMLREDHSLDAGMGGDGTVASHSGGSSHERKHLWRRSPRSDTKGPSFRQDHNNITDVLDTHTMQVNGKHSASTHMSSYNHLLKRGRLNECVELLEDMDRKDILDMNKIYHAKFFDLCRRQKAVKEAFRFAKLIPNPTLSTFNMLMSVCSTTQDSEGAFEVWQLVQRAGFKADCKLYTTLISTCAKSGKVDMMFEVFHEMVNGGVEPNVHTYGALIDGCARAGQVAKAFGAYGILRSKNVKPDRVVFNALITACGQSGAVERAFDVLTEMSAESQPIDPDHITIGSLIKACTSASQADRVKGVYGMIDQYNIKGTAELYTIAVNSCSQTGDWEFACNIFADMKKKGVVPDEMFFSALIDVAGHADNLDAAFEVLQDTRTQGIDPGIVSYSSLMGACSNTRNWKKALELFEQIKVMKLKPTVSTVNALITALCDAGQMQKALDVFSEIQELDLHPNDVTYSILLAASEKNDDLEVGLALFSQAKADGIPFNQIMCKCLIRMCSRRFEKASAIGEAVLSFTSGLPQIDSRWSSLALMIYREMFGAGLIPSTEMLSQVLGCLQLPKDVSLKKRLTETLGINAETSRNANLLPLIDGFAEYDPRAFSLFEEAASLGIVPGVSFKESPIFIDATNLNIHIAEVYILTVLKGLKHRLAAGAKLPSITISLPVEMAKISCPTGEKTINVSGRVSQAVGALFRRLRLTYQGNESNGKIRISGLAVKRWFQPKLVPSFSGKKAPLGLSQLRLAKGISRQQRNIRTGNLSLD